MSERAKEMDIASQLTFADGHWHFTLQAWLSTPRGADALVDILMLIKPLLAENAALPSQERGK